MKNYLKLAAATYFVASIPVITIAEGLERINVDPSFMFSEGNSAEVSFASINPSFPAVKGTGSLFTFASNLDPIQSFSAMTASVKTNIFDTVDLGIWYTTQGNGTKLDYGSIVSVDGTVTIKTDLQLPTLTALAKYNVNENISVFFGAKRVEVKSGGVLKLGSDTGGVAGLPDVTSHWKHTSASGNGAIYGVGYEMPEIALRFILMAEDDIDLKIPATAAGGVAASGYTTASIGDAISLNFQTGVAEDTLLFGNIRRSNWQDNQVKVPTAAGASQISTFVDGTSYSLGLGRKINEDLSVSISGFYDGSSGGAVSELAPAGATRTLSFGGKYAISENADLSLGASYSKRGDVLTANYKASFTDSKVISLGAKIGFRF
jgi:long-chain fatty acid transport protein